MGSLCCNLVRWALTSLSRSYGEAGVRAAIGAHARLDQVQFIPGLPKTRSGEGDAQDPPEGRRGSPDALGDVSTLADPSVVSAIIDGQPWT